MNLLQILENRVVAKFMAENKTERHENPNKSPKFPPPDAKRSTRSYSKLSICSSTVADGLFTIKV